MDNNISKKDQAILFEKMFASKPIRMILLVLIAVIFATTAQKRDPLLIKFVSPLGDSGSRIETFLLLNPNVEHQELTGNISNVGSRSDLGVDKSYAVDALKEPIRLIKVDLLKGTLAVLNILRGKVDTGETSFLGVEVNQSTDSAMRLVAVEYLHSLAFLVRDWLLAVAGFVGMLFLFNLRATFAPVARNK